MKNLFNAYEKTNIERLNFSGNELDSPTLLEWLNAITACGRIARGAFATCKQ